MSSALFTSGASIEQAHDDDIWHACWFPGKNMLATAGSDETVKIWDSQNGECLATLKDSDYAITSLDINAQGTRILTSSMDNKMRVWNIDDFLGNSSENSSPALTIDAGPINAWRSRFLQTVSESGTKEMLASSTSTGTVKLWSTTKGREVRELNTSRPTFLYALAVSPDGSKVACASAGNHVYVFDTESGSLLSTFSGHSDNVRSVSFSADSSLLVTGSDDKQIQLHDARYGSTVSTFSGHHSWVLSAKIHPDGKYIASGSCDTKVKIWDIGQRKCMETHSQHTQAVWDVAWQQSSDAVVTMRPKLASVGEDRSIHFYDPLLA